EFGGGFVGFGEFFAREGFELTADEVGRKASGEERAVDGGKLLIRNFLFHFGACKYKPRTPERTEFAFDALADEGSFVLGISGFGDGGVDVAVGNAAGAEVACDAEFSLLSDLGALASELFGVAGVIELARFLEAGEDNLGEEFAVGAAEKLLL